MSRTDLVLVATSDEQLRQGLEGLRREYYYLTEGWQGRYLVKCHDPLLLEAYRRAIAVLDGELIHRETIAKTLDASGVVS